MSLTSQRRIAAKILDIGLNRVWINPERIDQVETAITRGDIGRLIRDGVITARREKGVSRGRGRILAEKRKHGRRRGPGSREGKKTARHSAHRHWVVSIRALRRRLKELKENQAVSNEAYRKVYRMAKGGAFKNVSTVEQYIQASGLARKRTK